MKKKKIISKKNINRPQYVPPFSCRDREIITTAGGMNDESAMQYVEGFKPTVYELEVLAEHYMKAVRGMQIWWRYWNSPDGGEKYFEPFADWRLKLIAQCLGEKKFQQAISNVEEEWAKKSNAQDSQQPIIKSTSTN